MNRLNGFHTTRRRDKHYEYCSNNGHIKVKMSFEQEKWLKLNDNQNQFKAPFMLQPGFKGVLKPVVEQYKDRANQMKTEGKSKINTNVPSRWCVHDTFGYRDISDTLKMYCGKYCVEKFVEHIEDEVKRFYASFLQQQMKKMILY